MFFEDEYDGRDHAFVLDGIIVMDRCLDVSKDQDMARYNYSNMAIYGYMHNKRRCLTYACPSRPPIQCYGRGYNICHLHCVYSIAIL